MSASPNSVPSSPGPTSVTDHQAPGVDSPMAHAVAAAEHARLLAPPNPWVGACLVTADGQRFTGYTQRPGSNHAEVEALAAATAELGLGAARGATLYVTLEPCSHHGRTPPCVDAIIDAGVSLVVVAVLDPDPRVAGRGVAALEAAGIRVAVGHDAGVAHDGGEGQGGGEGRDGGGGQIDEPDHVVAVEHQLAPYLHHRRTGRPYVVLKLAATVDGKTAAPDHSSQWITGPEARADAHRLRAESDAILVGAGTVRADNPRLTVRDVVASDGEAPRPPLRVVLGAAPPDAAIQPCQQMQGDPEAIVGELGKQGIVQLMVEGGATVAASFHQRGLVDRYVVYLAPALMGGSDGIGLFHGPGAATIDALQRLQFTSIVRLGDDIRLDLVR